MAQASFPLLLLPRPTRLLPILLLTSAASLSACGGVSSTGTGGSSSSSATTTTGAGGAIPQARVIVRDYAGHPAIGVDVLVHDLDGATIQQTKTDKTGAANVDLVDGGGITALWRTDGDSKVAEYNAVSVVGLTRGAEIRLVADPVAPYPHVDMTLAFTGVAPLQSSAWNIVVSCDEEAMSGEQTLHFFPACHSDSYDLIAFLAPGDKRIVFPTQPVQAGMNVPFVLDLAKAEPAPALVVNFTGIPGATSWLGAGLTANRPEGGRTRFDIGKPLTSSQDVQLQISRLFVSPGGTFDLDLDTQTAAGGVRSRRYFQANDLPTSPIPWQIPTLTAVGKIGTLAGSMIRPEVPWALALGGTPTDAVRIQLEYQATDAPPPALGGTHTTRWALYQASTPTGTAKFPEIPPFFLGFTPETATLRVVADQVDVPGKDSLLAAVNADFDRVDVSFASSVSFFPSL